MRTASLIPALVLTAIACGDVAGQCLAPSPGDSVVAPDVRITARVRAAELRFDAQPRADVLPLGCVSGDTVRVLTRTNIPDPIVPGQVYRDVEIAVEIVTRLSVVCSPDLLRLLSNSSSSPRLDALCAAAGNPGGNRRVP